MSEQFLQAMQRKIMVHQTRESEAIHKRLDAIHAALLNLSGTYATHGEIEVMHQELGRIRELISEIDARTLPGE